MKNILFPLLLLTFSVNAQNVKIRNPNLSPVIASVFQDFSATVKLPTEKSALLAQYLQHQDECLLQEVKNGGPILKDLDLFSFDPVQFNQIIRAKPTDPFYQKAKLNISAISCALMFRNRLKIDPTQLDKLLKLNQQRTDDKTEVLQLSELLNPKQTAKLFELISTKEASDWALRDWQKFKTFKITDGLDSVEVYNIISDYRIKRLAFHNFYTRIDLKDSVDKGGFRHSTTDVHRVFLKALKTERYRIYFEKSNKDEVDAITMKNWEEIKSLGLANGMDSVKVTKELLNYEMDARFAGNQVFIENSLKSVFARQDLVNNKPAILRELEKAKSNSVNNKF